MGFGDPFPTNSEEIGISESEITKVLAEIEAAAEVGNVPPPRLQQILDKARDQMRGKP